MDIETNTQTQVAVQQTTIEQQLNNNFKIVLTEFYDADIMDSMLHDTTGQFSKRDLNNLSKYKKSRKGGNEVETIYHYGKGCEEQQIGRLYVRNCEGLQGFSFDIRNPLLEKHYWDVDMENCHYVLICKIGEKLGINVDNIKKYINNRDVELEKVSKNRKFAKTAFLKALYGNDITQYNEFYDDEDHIVEGDRTLIGNIANEINTIIDVMYSNDTYLNFKKFVKAKRCKNLKFSFLAYILQTEERKCLIELMNFMKSKNRNVDILIHDGCEIRKLQEETEFPIELLRECETYLLEKTNYNHKLVIKPLKHNYKIKEQAENPENPDIVFRKLSPEFEKTHCKIVDSSIYIKEYDDKVIIFSKEKIKTSYEHIECGKIKGIPQSFINKWINCNNGIRQYDTMDIYPNINECPEKCYNLWRPFTFQLYNSEYESNIDACNVMFNHIKILCNNDDITYNYFIKWIAHMMKYPNKKSTTPTLISAQGAGKGTLLKLLTIILGENKVLETSDPSRDVWGNFNDMMKNYYLINLNELSKRDTMDSESKIKTLQTDPTITISSKGINQYKIKSYHHFIITSNNDNPIKSTKDDRRNFIIRSSDEKKGDTAYFELLNSYMNDINIIRTIVDKFLSIEVNENFGSEPFPITKYQQELQQVERKPIDLFLENYVITHILHETITSTPTTLLNSYKTWCVNNGFNSEGINVQKFGLTLHTLFNDNERDNYILKKRTNKGQELQLNITNLKTKYNISDEEEEQVEIEM
jgi:hypothetical protein